VSSSPFRSGVSFQAPALSICIIGAGFRGLGVLERIVAFAGRYEGARPIKVHLVDASHGPEQYDPGQPDYLLLNIVCSQVSMFPDVASVGNCPPTTGPSLYEWVRERGLLLGEDGFTVGQQGRPIEEGDFLPRRLLGEYLIWFRALLKKLAGSRVDVVEHYGTAADITPADNLSITLTDGTIIAADYLFLTVGQPPEPTTTDDTRAFGHCVVRPYPLPDQLDLVNAGDTVAVAGLGLSAVDAILALTIGRGGRVRTINGVDRYFPSGREPRIVAYSRSGLPYRSRPVLGASIGYDAIVFTRENIDALRAERGPQLDYDRDVLPLLLTELRIAYWRALRGKDYGWSDATVFLEELRAACTVDRLELNLAELDARHGLFDSRLAYFGALPSADDGDVLEDSAAYQTWCQQWLDDDLHEARLGVARSPLKAALEICRQFRDVIRHAVDFGGLTQESSDRFFSFHSETLNRIGVGPQKERTADILALMSAGILSIPLGPNPTVTWDALRQQWHLRSSSLRRQCDVFANWLYYGLTSRLRSLAADPAIVGAMVRRGLLRRFRPDSSVVYAIDVDESFHPISSAGSVEHRIWVLGLLCEGVTFYNGYVTSPGKFVRSQHDADRAVAEIFSNSIGDEA
jgi:hypothetical protein